MEMKFGGIVVLQRPQSGEPSFSTIPDSCSEVIEETGRNLKWIMVADASCHFPLAKFLFVGSLRGESQWGSWQGKLQVA